MFSGFIKCPMYEEKKVLKYKVFDMHEEGFVTVAESARILTDKINAWKTDKQRIISIDTSSNPYVVIVYYEEEG